jgi:hypothetical protein
MYPFSKDSLNLMEQTKLRVSQLTGVSSCIRLVWLYGRTTIHSTSTCVCAPTRIRTRTDQYSA